MAIQDFGEKIGGAKKDLWKERGMIISDLSEMNEAERLKLIKKDAVWQKPDYAELVANGMSRRVAWFVKTVRDSLAAKPVLTYLDSSPEVIRDKQEKYIEFVGAVRDAVMGCKTEADVLAVGKREWLVEKGYIQPGNSYYISPTAAAGDVITNKFLKAFVVTQYKLSSYDREMDKKQFLFSDEEKILSKYSFFKYENAVWETDYRGVTLFKLGGNYFYPKGEFENKDSWENGTYILSNARHDILGRNFESLEAVKKFVLEKDSGKESEKPKKKGKTRFVPAQLAHIKREGDDVRVGRSMTGQDYLNAFQFKGGEFGNWMSEKDRQASLNMGYEALYDLAKALKIDLKDISLGGALSIAFGARGSGSALAHYEPLREVINLTKMRGAGSLAHEWGHALDDILGKRLGLRGFMSANVRRPGVPESFKSLINKMKYAEIFNEDIKKSREEEIDTYKSRVTASINRQFPVSSMTDYQINKLDALIKNYFDNAPGCDEGYFEYVTTGSGNKDIDALSDFRKEVTGRVISKEERIVYAQYQYSLCSKLKLIDRPQRVKTDFYENSLAFDQEFSKTDHGYWSSTEEMFARAFACYVHDKVEGRSDYLCGHSEMAVTNAVNKGTGDNEFIAAIPQGEERKVINQCFDELVQELKEKGLLHHKEDFSVEVRRERGEPEFDRLPETEEEAYPVTLLDMLDDAYGRSEKTDTGKQIEFDLDKGFFG